MWKVHAHRREIGQRWVWRGGWGTREWIVDGARPRRFPMLAHRPFNKFRVRKPDAGGPRRAAESRGSGRTSADAGGPRRALRRHGGVYGRRRWLSRVPTTLLTVGSSVQSRSIFRTALMTVEWSLPPNRLPISGKLIFVSLRARYIATMRG
jgi:hypothetical protein